LWLEENTRNNCNSKEARVLRVRRLPPRFTELSLYLDERKSESGLNIQKTQRNCYPIIFPENDDKMADSMMKN
jgi:hypothetical protein